MELLELLRNNVDDRDNIIGRDKYFNSSVLVALCTLNGIPNFILQKRSPHIRQGGEISFPGGGYEEKDGTFLETAIRETIEEMGISRNKIEILGKVGTMIIPTGILVEAYLGHLHIDTIEEFRINKDEVEKLLFIPVDFFKITEPRVEKIGITSHPTYLEKGVKKTFPAKELNLPDIYHKPWTSKPRNVSFFFYEGEVIWGITADIIIEVINFINKIDKITMKIQK